MPSGTGCSVSANVRPASGTPAFANAKIGSTPKATQGCSACSSGFDFASGMNIARITPASVACTPDFSTATHSTMPTSR